MTSKGKPLRFERPTGAFPSTRVLGRKASPHEDVYHFVLNQPWWRFFAFVACMFILGNALFAGLYGLQPGAIANARPGSFEDAFFFSVQTMATIGYGAMAPATRFGHVMVTLEAMVGMFGVALVTGITFAKFSRPTAKVLFAHNTVIAPRNGVPHLMFRVANWRHNSIVDAQLRATLLVSERTTEGQTLRRLIDLPLVRDRTPLFSMTWVVMHRIEAESPFFGDGAIARLEAEGAELLLSLLGFDETMSQTVHARHLYALRDLVPGALFHDVLRVLGDGTREIDYRHFHDVVPIEEAPRHASTP